MIQGTKKLSKFKKIKLNKIFLITSSKNEIENRLKFRNQNSDEEIKKRIRSFDDDIKHWKDYDYVIINQNLDVCFRQIESIILNHKRDKLNFI